jgi:hypothetical protein
MSLYDDRSFISNIIFKIKRTLKFFWQRRTRGFDDSVIWNLDNRISEFILPRLKLFKEKAPDQGIPSEFIDESPLTAIKDPKEREAARTVLEDEGQRKWEEVLDKIIWSFEYADNGYEDNATANEFMAGQNDPNIKKQCWEIYLEKNKALYNKYLEGMRLFAEHFNDLWT